MAFVSLKRIAHSLKFDISCHKILSSYSSIDFSRYYTSKKDGANIDQTTGQTASKDDDKSKTKVDKKGLASSEFSEASKEAAKKKLLNILADLQVESNIPKQKSELPLAKPLKRITKKQRFPQTEPVDKEQEAMKSAIQAVASHLKGDAEKTQSELLDRVETMKMPSDVEESPEKDIDNVVEDETEDGLMASVKEVASTLTENPESIKSELTKKLMQLSVSDQKQKIPMSLFEGLKIQGMKKEREKLRPPKREGPIARQFQSNFQLSGSGPLNIFKVDKQEGMEENQLWSELQEKENRLLVQFAPTNAFEEMILWTEQGKHWKFPINNDIDMGAEENIGFHEHIFLERHLDGFPTQGPIRQFMDLVVVGLSKNPYITVDRKIENIDWFRQYFKEKEGLLKECGVQLN